MTITEILAITINRHGDALRSCKPPGASSECHDRGPPVMKLPCLPDGDPGHSTIISEETGQPINFK
jgi:hypothetical protein